MDVTMLRWPDEHARRSRISQAHEPRLLLVPDGEEPPAVVDCLEDWIRIPATENEVRARVDALAVRSQAHNGHANGNGNGNANGHDQPASPMLDDFGVLRVNGAWVALPPLEARLTETLLERLGAVTSRELLIRAGWPSGAPGRNALDVHVLRLRRRLQPVGLAIRTVRSRGYLLEPAPA
ncbi:MAG TPA: winged helix-turn-helix domain-containing protein [Acidimicrobiales bacterium]|jgi:DNA-binding response OmpR family regulator|nr:winged helix-turn-helix domain-containing protein [Acidimicrobiales bacterium]